MCIFKFKSGLANRIATWKTWGFIVWLLGFILLSVYFDNVSLIFRLWILFWYTTMWWIIWLFGIIDSHPVFPKWKFPFWFRWIFLWAWMNFLLVLFTYDQLLVLSKPTSIFAWFSPYWIILEWAIIWLIIEYFATKSGWEGKKIIK